MRKLYIGLVLAQFFILFSGCNLAFARSIQNNTHSTVEVGTDSESGDITDSQEAKGPFFKPAASNQEQENYIFDFLFSESEEEIEKLNLDFDFDSNYFVVLLWAKILGHLPHDEIAGYFHHKDTQLSSVDRCVAYQVFRI